ncbi:hypothetical protein IKU74_02275 [bacterium]|nr:hypothetical protein [bacterium]
MFSPVASTIFAFRNAEKTKNGEVGRSVVTVGQGVGVLKEVAKYDNIFAAGAKGALDAFNTMAKENKALSYAGKCLKFTADNVNPLICASGVIKVAMSDDKVHDGIVESVSLAGMFAGEALMKDNFNDFFNEKTFKSIAKKAEQSGVLKDFAELVQKSKYTGKVASVLKGVAFVMGSIGSYSLAQKVGEKYADNIMDAFGLERKEKIDQKV